MPVYSFPWTPPTMVILFKAAREEAEEKDEDREEATILWVSSTVKK